MKLNYKQLKKIYDTTYTFRIQLNTETKVHDQEDTIAKAARGEEGYEDMTPLEALAYVGLTGQGGECPLLVPYL